MQYVTHQYTAITSSDAFGTQNQRLSRFQKENYCKHLQMVPSSQCFSFLPFHSSLDPTASKLQAGAKANTDNKPVRLALAKGGELRHTRPAENLQENK